ncbi:MAG: efflux RND transporter permease subunit [Deltaproteobacteria bacterium]|nr:efflux RND transporter permease subunit [Deltaproteobacteria bacterium]
MNLSEIAVKRPVFTVMVAFGLMVLGLVGLTRLGTDLFPDVSFPVVTVTVVYPGAAPAEVETLVTKPLEYDIVSLNGIDRVMSNSREGVSTVIALFKLGVDIEEATTQVRERVARNRIKLPADILEPSVGRLDTTAAPVVVYTVRGNRSLNELRNFVDDVVRPELEQVDGVAKVTVNGGADREFQVNLDQARLDALNLSPDRIVGALRMGGLTVPAGKLTQGSQDIAVRTVGDLRDVEDLRNLVVATQPNGSEVRLREVGTVDDGWKEMTSRIFVNGQEAVSFDVIKQSGRNTMAVADGIRAKVEKMEKTWPDEMRAARIMDQATFIKENAHEVEIAIVFGGAMAILIILIFMLDLRSTLISAVALPTSVIATFFVMYALGFTLNMMTLLGLSLAIGLLIDDAVVVRENIFKHLERGSPPMQAALEGTREIALAVMATTFTVVAVFLPVAFMDGIVGQFFKQFGVTVSASVMLSLFVAFTLDPMLSSRFSKPIEHGKPDRFAAVKAPFERFFARMDDTYRVILGWSVNHKLVVGVLAVGSLVGTGAVVGAMGSDFVAPEDRGQFNLEVELPAGTSLGETARQSEVVVAKLREDPLIVTVMNTVGADGDANKARFRILTVPKQQRSVSLVEIQSRARELAKAVPGAKVAVQDIPMIEGAQGQAPIMINVRGANYDELEKAAAEVAGVLRSVPGIVDVQVNHTPGKREYQVAIDRQRAADQGISVAQVAMGLRTAIDGDDSVKVRLGDDQVPVRVRLQAEDRATSASLLRTTLMSPKGPVSLADVARIQPGEGPQVIQREDRNRYIGVWARPRGRSLGEVTAELQPKIAKLELPKGVDIRYDGQIKQMAETNGAMGLALLLGVVFIYIVLASQFESFIHPLTIMTTLPLAIVGAVVALFLTKNTIAMGALIGIILLMGLVTKNAILLVDRAIERVREHGEAPLAAILAAGPERLRPILMTSAAMTLGMLPTALSRGDGSEFRAPMAIAVIGGVVSSTLLSLVVVPALYLAVEGAKRAVAGLFRRGASAPQAAE